VRGTKDDAVAPTWKPATLSERAARRAHTYPRTPSRWHGVSTRLSHDTRRPPHREQTPSVWCAGAPQALGRTRTRASPCFEGSTGAVTAPKSALVVIKIVVRLGSSRHGFPRRRVRPFARLSAGSANAFRRSGLAFVRAASPAACDATSRSPYPTNRHRTHRPRPRSRPPGMRASSDPHRAHPRGRGNSAHCR